MDSETKRPTQDEQAGRLTGALLTFVIYELTLVTAYIHLGLGGTLFTLNAVGYLTLGAAYVATVIVPLRSVRGLAWLSRLALASFTVITIGAYLVMGPHFALGWITKGIEVAIVGLLLADWFNSRRRSAF